MGKVGRWNRPLPWNMRREAFVKNVESPGRWLFSAKILESAATALEARLMSAMTKMQHEGAIPEDAVWFGPAFLLLAGYAIENAAKALLVQRKDLKVQADKLPKQLDRHGAEKLLQECGVALSPEEVEFIRRLDTAVEWVGRYPVPRRAQSMELAKGTGSQDLRRLRDLIARIEGLVRPRGGTR